MLHRFFRRWFVAIDCSPFFRIGIDYYLATNAMINDAITEQALTIVEVTEILNELFWLYLEFSLRILLGST
jgi:hypothetical protein